MPASVSSGTSLRREHAGLGDLAELAVIPSPLPVAHHEKGDVVAGEAGKIRKDSMELSRRGKTHADLLLKLSGKRRLDGLVPLDAAAGKEPAGTIAVPHEEDAGRSRR